MPPTSLLSEISSIISSQKSITPSQAWLSSFLSSQKPNIPIEALTKTAIFRLLASEITVSFQPTPDTTFPQDIHNVEIQERRLKGPIAVQVVDIEDITKSKLMQLESLEAAERGEKTKGKEVIRVVQVDNDSSTPNDVLDEQKDSSGPHKVLVEDSKGVRVFGVEVRPIEGINLGMNIGTKMILRDVKACRGVLMLDNKNTVVVGGKVEDLHKKWREGRKERLKSEIAALKELE